MFIYLFIYLYVCVCVCVCVLWLGCHPPPPIIIITTPSFNAALHQAPDASGCVRAEGRWNSRSGSVWWGTPEVNEASSPPLLYAESASSLLMHAGVLVGPGRERRGIPRRQSCRTRGPDENHTRYTADGPGCRAVYPHEAPWVRRTKPPPPCALDLSGERMRPLVSAPSLDPSFWTLPILH